MENQHDPFANSGGDPQPGHYQGQSQSGFGGGGTEDAPNATIILVLGILSIVLALCVGFVGLILGIVAIFMANSSLKAYKMNPERYKDPGNVRTGRICGIVGVILASLSIILSLIFSILGWAVGGLTPFF